MDAVVFKGFASPIVGNTETLYDVDLVRQDLINHFNTKKGERAFNASYGFIGWDLIFEIEGYDVQNLLEADCRRIVSEDPRLELLAITIGVSSQLYQINMTLKYVQLETVQDLTIVFDARSNDRMATFSVS